MTRRRRSQIPAPALLAAGLVTAGWAASNGAGPAAALVLVAAVAVWVVGTRTFLAWSSADWLDFLATRALPWLGHRLWLWRAGLLPVWAAVCAAGAGWALAAAVGPGWWPAPAAAGATVAGVLALYGERLADPLQRAWLALIPSALDDGHKGVLDRPLERAYVAALAAGAGGWLAARLALGWTPATRWALLAGAVAYGIPWWYHHGWRRRRATSKWVRRWGRVEGNELLKGWHRSRIVAVEGTKRATTLVVRTRAAITIKHVGGDSLALSSALGLRPGAVTVTIDKSSAARVRVRVVPRDPWRGALLHPLPGVATLSLDDAPRVRIGDYEDATECLLKVQQHMMVVGQTGSGKSVLLEALLAWLLSYRHARIVGADLANGATFGIWRDVLATPLATDVHSALRLLGGVFQEIERREALLARRKLAGELIDVLPADADNPAVWVVIDEFPDLVKAAKLAELPVITLLERLANKARKVNIWLVLGAQNPTAHDVGSTELRGALTAVVGLALSETQSKTLWGTARQQGWDSTPLRTGTFLLADRDAEHQEPRVAKGLYVPPGARLELIRAAAATPRRLPPAGQRALEGDPGAAAPPAPPRLSLVTPPPPPGGDRAGPPAAPAVAPRSAVATAPRDELDDRIAAELPDPGEATVEVTAIAGQLGVTRDKVNRGLRRLARAGRVRDAGYGRWERT